jgi:hypothetical protein
MTCGIAPHQTMSADTVRYQSVTCCCCLSRRHGRGREFESRRRHSFQAIRRISLKPSKAQKGHVSRPFCAFFRRPTVSYPRPNALHSAAQHLHQGTEPKGQGGRNEASELLCDGNAPFRTLRLPSPFLDNFRLATTCPISLHLLRGASSRL